MTDLPIDRYRDATEHMRNIDADWARAITLIGPCTLDSKSAREPYEALVRAVAYQQLSTKVGDTILGRFKALYPGASFPSPEQLVETEFDLLRGCGFSSRKIETIKTIAAATLTGLVPSSEAAASLDNEELIARLVTLKGIGRWTVEMLLMFTLERPDVLPVDDLGVREGYRLLKSLDTQPSPKQLRALGEAWAPYRTVASWYLWRMPRGRG